jgi:hypothetical protein
MVCFQNKRDQIQVNLPVSPYSLVKAEFRCALNTLIADLLVQHRQQSQQVFPPAGRPGFQAKLPQHFLSRLAPQFVLALHSLIHGKVFQFVFHPAANHHQFVPMQHQLA